MAITVTITSKKDGLVAVVAVVSAREESLLSVERARIWLPTLADLHQHYPEKLGYQFSVRG
jgi:hypothetical protein